MQDQFFHKPIRGRVRSSGLLQIRGQITYTADVRECQRHNVDLLTKSVEILDGLSCIFPIRFYVVKDRAGGEAMDCVANAVRAEL